MDLGRYDRIRHSLVGEFKIRHRSIQSKLTHAGVQSERTTIVETDCMPENEYPEKAQSDPIEAS